MGGTCDYTSWSRERAAKGDETCDILSPSVGTKQGLLPFGFCLVAGRLPLRCVAVWLPFGYCLTAV